MIEKGGISIIECQLKVENILYLRNEKFINFKDD